MSWEYRVETVDLADVDTLRDRLNELGIQGWELVTIQNPPGFANMLAVLKPMPFEYSVVIGG